MMTGAHDMISIVAAVVQLFSFSGSTRYVYQTRARTSMHREFEVRIVRVTTLKSIN